MKTAKTTRMNNLAEFSYVQFSWVFCLSCLKVFFCYFFQNKIVNVDNDKVKLQVRHAITVIFDLCTCPTCLLCFMFVS